MGYSDEVLDNRYDCIGITVVVVDSCSVLTTGKN